MIILSVISLAAQEGWVRQHPRLQSHVLTAVHAHSKDVVTAVGHFGTIVRTIDGGDTWTQHETYTLADFRSVQFLNDLVGVAAGDSGMMFRTENGGASWYRISSGTSKRLYDAACLDINTIVAVSDSGFIHRSSDAGATWTKQKSGTKRDLRSVAFANAMTGNVVGYQGTILRTIDGGITWSPQASNEQLEAYHPYSSVRFSTPKRGTISWDGSGILRTTNGGASWQFDMFGTVRSISEIGPMAAIVTTNGKLESYNQDDGFGYGASSGYGQFNDVCMADVSNWFAVGLDGFIARTRDGGENWQQLQTELRTTFYGIDYSEYSMGLAVGDRGIILHTQNDGDTWYRVSQDIDNTLWRDVIYVQNMAYVIGVDSILRMSTIECNQPNMSPSDMMLYRASFCDSLTGIIAGKNITRLTSDGGVTWQYDASTNRTFWDVAYAGRNVIFATNADSGTVERKVRNQGFRRCTPDGMTGLYSVCFSDSMHGTAVGDTGKIIRTTDGGNTWVTQNSGTRSLLLHVDFFDNNHGMAVGMLGTILATTNGGATWRLQRSGVAHQLESVSMIDAYRATVCGSGSTILRTSNGGNPSQVGSTQPSDHRAAALGFPYPNPTSDYANIPFHVARGGRVLIDVCDSFGNVVAVVVNDVVNAGDNNASLQTNTLQSGMYILRLQTDSELRCISLSVVR